MYHDNAFAIARIREQRGRQPELALELRPQFVTDETEGPGV
jgi:hypothetical protein